MNNAQLRAAISSLEISQVNLALQLGIDPRTLRRFIAHTDAAPIPRAIDLAVRYLLLQSGNALPHDLD